MAARTMPVTLEQGKATCSDPEHLPLVDAAFAKPGGPEAQEMKAALCRHCPVGEQCLAWGMTHAEAGIWGGVSPRMRGDRGAPRGITPVAHVRVDGTPAQPAQREAKREAKARGAKPGTVNATTLRCQELGVKPSEVKRWAYERGIVRTARGRVSMAAIEAWVAARALA